MFGAARAQVRAQLYGSLAALTDAGLSIGEALTIAGRDMTPSPLTSAVQQMGHEVSGGRDLAEALRRRTGLFSSLETATVEVGAATGRYDRAFRNLRDFYERECDLRHLLTRELSYPMLLFAAIIFIPLIADFVRILITSTLVAAVGAILLRLLALTVFVGIPVALVLVVARNMRASEEGRTRLDAMKLSLPLVGPIFRKVALARFCRALASLYASGVMAGTAIRLAGDAAGNEAVKRDLTAHAAEVDRGGSLSAALEHSSLMPSSVLHVLKTGEVTGDVDSMAESAAKHLELEAQTSVKQLAVSIVPVAVVIAGIIVAVMVISFYVGFYSL